MNSELSKEEIKKYLHDFADENQTLFANISDYIFKHPELGGVEFKSSKYLGEFMKEHGFDVSFPYDTLPTAFIADFKNGNDLLTFGFLAEYDGLPGYGENGTAGHACGHNWISASMVGCAITLSKISKDMGFNVKLIGTPAEETFGAKYDLINLGAFDNVDFAFQAHMDCENSMYVNTLAMNSIEFTFKGLASHSAQAPEKGINALDAVISMFVNVNALRQQTRADSRIHGIITNGGKATNIIPDFAQCQFTIRATDKAYLSKMRESLINIAKGAALSTGTELSYRDFENPFDNMLNIKSFVEVAEKNFKDIGVENFKKEDDKGLPGSSDIGNVSYVCPTLYAELGLEVPESFRVHHPSAMLYANSPIAYNKMTQTIKAFTSTVVDIILDEQTKKSIEDEFKYKLGK
ncbi:MAG: M20 family metallopeptidase [Filifactoraceae bacterium]